MMAVLNEAAEESSDVDVADAIAPARSWKLAWLVLLAAVAVMAMWTWGGWPDPTVDFGTQLYVPWRITQGEVLYRDLAYFKGPFSPYFNALLFTVLGASLRTLVIANFAILFVTLVLLRVVLRQWTDDLPATICLLLVVFIFAFVQYRYLGNYNWITPYAHEYTHGIALSLGALLAMHSFARSGRKRYAVIAGTLTGLVFLTTAEVFAACASATIAGMFVALRQQGMSRKVAIRIAAGFAACAIAVPFVAWALLSLAMPAGEALHGTLGSWVWVLDTRIADLGFYRASMGLDDPSRRLLRLLMILGGEVAFFAVAFGVAGLIPHLRWRRPARIATVLVAAIAGAFLGWALRRFVPWYELALPLPIVVAAIAIVSTFRAVRRREPGRVRFSGPVTTPPANNRSAEADPTDTGTKEVPADLSAAARLMFATFALILLAKMLLYSRVQHYGFTLALPAAVLAVELLVGTIPRWLEARGRAGKTFRAIAIAALAAYVVGILYGHHLFTQDKTVAVAKGADHFRADERGEQVNAALRLLEQRSRPGDTLAVLPQGLMVNYLARLPHPNRYLNYMPPEVISAGEAEIVRAYGENPPDWILLARVNVRGDAFYLLDGDYAYGGELLRWVKERYEVVAVVPGPSNDRSAEWLVMRHLTPLP